MPSWSKSALTRFSQHDANTSEQPTQSRSNHTHPRVASIAATTTPPRYHPPTLPHPPRYHTPTLPHTHATTHPRYHTPVKQRLTLHVRHTLPTHIYCILVCRPIALVFPRMKHFCPPVRCHPSRCQQVFVHSHLLRSRHPLASARWVVMVWYAMVLYGMVGYGMVWYGMVWYGMVWYGMVWHGMAWYGRIPRQTQSPEQTGPPSSLPPAPSHTLKSTAMPPRTHTQTYSLRVGKWGEWQHTSTPT